MHATHRTGGGSRRSRSLPAAWRALAVSFPLALTTPALAVDLNASLKGVVQDSDGLPVPNADVTISSEDMMGDRSKQTDAEGRFRFTTLPPGDYTVRVVHPGFSPWESTGVRLNLGGNVQLDITLPSSDAGETITVTGETPTVDVESVVSGAVMDADFLKDVPIGRDYLQAISVAPGVVGSGNAYVHGGFDSSNQFYVDGVNITDPMTNTFSTNMNYDTIESIQVLTGGMDAEYGRALGGAFNVITKSGGNEFEGQVFLSYRDPSFIIAEELEGDSNDENLAQQIALTVGGPIIRDKVWFYTSVQADRLVRTSSINTEEVDRDLDKYPMAPRDWRSVYLFAKVSAQPAPEHHVWAQWMADPTWIDNVFQDPYTLPSGEGVQNQGGWLSSVGHKWTPNDQMLLETQAYYQTSYINFFPILWKDCNNFDENQLCTDEFNSYQGNDIPSPGFYAWGAGDFSAGEHPYASFNTRRRMSANTALSLWFDALGEHHVKVGGQAEYMTSYYIYPGIGPHDGDPSNRGSKDGLAYYEATDTDGDGEVDPNDFDGYQPVQLYVYDNDWEAQFTGTIFSWYVQDVWKPHPRLSLRPGLRWDAPILRNDQGTSVFSRLTTSPRFGAAFDLTGDGKTSLYGYYGRFYDTGFLAVSDLLRQKSAGFSAYGWDPDLGDWSPNPTFSVSDTFLKHEDLRNPYSDEFNLGINREVGTDFAVGVRGVYERHQNFWEDDEVNLIWNDEGDTVLGYRNGENVAIYRLRTPDEVYTEYKAMELTFQKYFSKNWTLIGSYTWSETTGTNDDHLATGVWDIPEQRQYERGVLSTDRTHSIKATGSYNKPDVWTLSSVTAGYVLGWDFRMYSGLPYRRLVWNNYYGSYGNYENIGTGRYRLPALSQLDLRAGLQFESGRFNWMAGVDMFNVFNSRTTTSVNSQYDPEATGDDQPFGEILDRQDPRRFDVIVRGSF